VKVVVLTTSYPRDEQDVAGSFVARSVEAVRALGVEVDVVSPASFRHFGVAYGAGIAQNIRASPWKVLRVPGFLAAYAVAARRAARDADLVHAHWIPSALAAEATRKPYLLQVWGTDVELAMRAPMFARPLIGRARRVVAASRFLSDAAHRLGATTVDVVPPPIEIPDRVRPPADPPHVLYAGRLSEEKGIVEFLEATEGLPRVVVGDGPLRDLIPDDVAVGWVPPHAIGEWYERASVVCVPSRREGYGMAAREALAYGRPVVATRVGGLADLGRGAILVPPGDAGALRVAVVDALARASELGAEARDEVAAEMRPEVAARRLTSAYRAALSG
jgi:glycosyltransferase involved in cell wall biosynthesis